MRIEPQARAIAAHVLSGILCDRQSLVMLEQQQARLSDPRDRTLLQEFCYGVCRWYYPLEFILSGLLNKPLKSRDMDIKALALLGLYQFMYMRIPPHAIIAATVEATRELNKDWAGNLINALLRRFQREQADWQQKLEGQPANIRYSLPGWLLQQLQRDYPETWEDIARNNNLHPPMFLRVNLSKTTRGQYRQQLLEHAIGAEETPYSEAGLCLESAVDTGRLPRFNDGHVSVQDLAAQLACGLLDLQQGQRVLDACAAPGGKLAHILECGTDLREVVALENDKKRLQKLRQTLERLDLHATVHHADARKTESWWDGKQFDRILLDTPCTASGVIRRHPDIRLRRSPDDINTVALLQSELLSALWPVLNSRGKLLYVTCSVFSRENDEQIQQFLEKHTDAQCIPIHAEWGDASQYGRQIQPGQDNMDGFYYACLQKKENV